MTFGSRLKALREGLGMTGEELGALVGASKQSVAHWESGRYEPSMSRLADLCKIFNVSADYLLLGSRVPSFGPETLELARAYEALDRRQQGTWKALIQIARGTPTQRTVPHEPNVADELMGGDSGLVNLDTKPKRGRR